MVPSGKPPYFQKKCHRSVFRPNFYFCDSNFDLNCVYNSKFGRLTSTSPNFVYSSEPLYFVEIYLFNLGKRISLIYDRLSLEVLPLQILKLISFFQNLLNSNKTDIPLKFELEGFDCFRETSPSMGKLHDFIKLKRDFKDIFDCLGM